MVFTEIIRQRKHYLTSLAWELVNWLIFDPKKDGPGELSGEEGGIENGRVLTKY